jgi:hypothetical protein
MTQAMPAHDLKYVAAVAERLPNMDEMQNRIIAETQTDGDGGSEPWRFTFDTDTHKVTLVWPYHAEAWELESLEPKRTK